MSIPDEHTVTLKRIVGTFEIRRVLHSKHQVCDSSCTQTVIWMLSASNTSPLLSITQKIKRIKKEKQMT